MSRVDVSVGKNKKEEEGKKWIEEDKGRQLTAKKHSLTHTHTHTHPVPTYTRRAMVKKRWRAGAHTHIS